MSTPPGYAAAAACDSPALNIVQSVSIDWLLAYCLLDFYNKEINGKNVQTKLSLFVRFSYIVTYYGNNS